MQLNDAIDVLVRARQQLVSRLDVCVQLFSNFTPELLDVRLVGPTFSPRKFPVAFEMNTDLAAGYQK